MRLVIHHAPGCPWFLVIPILIYVLGLWHESTRGLSIRWCSEVIKFSPIELALFFGIASLLTKRDRGLSATLMTDSKESVIDLASALQRYFLCPGNQLTSDLASTASSIHREP